MLARGDGGRDSGEMQEHRGGIAVGQDEGRALALFWADRAENVCGGGALILRRARAGSAPGPAPCDLVLLADARLVGEPEFYGFEAEPLFASDLRQAGREVFLKSSMACGFCA